MRLYFSPRLNSAEGMSQSTSPEDIEFESDEEEPEPAKVSSLFKHFKLVVRQITIQVLETIRSLQSRVSDSNKLLEHVLYLPDVSEETLVVVDCILSNCRLKEHLPVLLYYGPIFRRRVRKTHAHQQRDDPDYCGPEFWRRFSVDQEMDDVDRLTLIFRGTSKFHPSIQMKEAFAESLYARFLVRRNVEDIEESINIARPLLPHTNWLLRRALRALDTFYQKKAYDASEESRDEMIDAMRRSVDCLEELVLISQNDDEFSQNGRIHNQVKLFETLSRLAKEGHDKSHLDRAKLVFEEVWKRRNWIMSAPDMPHSTIVIAFSATLVRFYNLTGGGSEYLQRLVQLEDVATSVRTPEVRIQLHATIASAFRRRFYRFHALEDLRLSVHHWEHVVEKTKNPITMSMPIIPAGFKTTAHGHLIDAYWDLGAETNEHDEEVAARCRECARSLHAHMAQAPDGPRTHSGLLNAARGYLCHFFIGGPNNSESFDSLREAFSILSSKRFLILPMGHEAAETFFDLVRQLARALEMLFVATSDIHCLELAVLCHRSLLCHFSDGLSFRKHMNFQALAHMLFLRMVYLRSTPISRAPEESRSAGTSLEEAFDAMSNVLGLGDDRAGFHGRGTRILPGSLDARLAVRDEGDEDSEWFYLLVKDASTQRDLLTIDEHHCEFQARHSFDFIKALASLALHSFHDKHREVSIAAFKEAISILQRIFIIQPSVRSQRSILEKGNPGVRDVLSIPSKAASYAIGWNEVELAVEFLEHGRSLVWSRMRGLRVAETELNNVDEALRTRFANICKELEEIVTQETPADPLASSSYGFRPMHKSMARVGFEQPINIVDRRTSMEKEFDSVVEEIRKVPGYEEFLQMTPYSTLRNAAREGPIIILTVVFSNKGVVRLPNHGAGHAIIVRDSQTPPVLLRLGEGKAFEAAISNISYTLQWIRESLSKTPVETTLIDLRSTISELSEILRKNNNARDSQAPVSLRLGEGEIFETAFAGISSTLSDVREYLRSAKDNMRQFSKGEVFDTKLSGINSSLSKIRGDLRKNNSVRDSQDPVTRQLVEGDAFETALEDISSTLSDIRRILERECNKVLSKMLEEIGEVLVKKIVDRLKEMGVKRHSRIWWCPISGLSAFPLHAAMWKERITGSSSKSRFRCLSDFYVSSYTPSLSALIRARSLPCTRGTKGFDGPPTTVTHQPMLIVGQRDESLATVDQEIENIASEARKAGRAGDLLNVIMGGSENERDEVLDDLKKRVWVHFACHGILEESDPFSSHFQISDSDEKSITLMDVIRSNVPNAEFAFLSACHSAQQSVGFAPDESLHLAAAMQFCGFRTVIGTMWPLQDDDGPRVAKEFYEYMFAEPKEGEEIGYMRSARALNKVTRSMRREREYKQSLERWVNFIHIGA